MGTAAKLYGLISSFLLKGKHLIHFACAVLKSLSTLKTKGRVLAQIFNSLPTQTLVITKNKTWWRGGGGGRGGGRRGSGEPEFKT